MFCFPQRFIILPSGEEKELLPGEKAPEGVEVHKYIITSTGEKKEISPKEPEQPDHKTTVHRYIDQSIELILFEIKKFTF